MKQIITLFAALLISICAFSQDVDFKKGIIYVDGKETFKYEGSDIAPAGMTIYNMKGEEIMMMRHDRNRMEEVYRRTVFIKEKKTLISKYTILGKKDLIEKLIKGGAIVDGNIVLEKLETFFLKYDEHEKVGVKVD